MVMVLAKRFMLNVYRSSCYSILKYLQVLNYGPFVNI